MRPIDRILFAAGALFVAAWFATLARPGLTAWFSGDDLMNLHGAWTAGAWGLTESRPLGALWYRALYAAAGFDPLPFHATAWAILLGNCALTYALARRLSGRREIAALAALLVSYHARCANLYLDTGAIYDVLCYCFYLASLLWYVRVRQCGVLPGWRQMLVLLALFVGALGAKEMAVTLPVAIAAYEWLYHPPRRGCPGAWRTWLADECRTAIAAGAVAAIYAVNKVTGPHALAQQPGYRISATAPQAMANARHYLDLIFYRYDAFTTAGVLALWLAMLAVAVLGRSRALRFAWAFLTFSIVPMLFVDPRGGSAIYLCLFGWALYAACAAVYATDPLRRFVPERAKAVALFLAVAALLWPLHRFEGEFSHRSAAESGEFLRGVDTALHRSVRQFRSGARILFLNDPFRPQVFDLSFLIHLSYADKSLAVERVRMHPALQADATKFDYVIDYAGGRFLLLRRP